MIAQYLLNSLTLFAVQMTDPTYVFFWGLFLSVFFRHNYRLLKKGDYLWWEMTDFEKECNWVTLYWIDFIESIAEDLIEAERRYFELRNIKFTDYDPTIAFYNDLMLYVSITIIILFGILFVIKLVKVAINYKLLALNNKFLRKINFFRFSVLSRLNYIKKNNLVDCDQIVYEALLWRIDEFVKTKFWVFKSEKQFESMRLDMADFHFVLINNNDYALTEEFLWLDRFLFSEISEKKIFSFFRKSKSILKKNIFFVNIFASYAFFF